MGRGVEEEPLISLNKRQHCKKNCISIVSYFQLYPCKPAHLSLYITFLSHYFYVVVWYFKQTLFFFFLLLMEEKDGIDLLKSTDGEKKVRMESTVLRSKWFLLTELRIYLSLRLSAHH